jgi:hypothetical protein
VREVKPKDENNTGTEHTDYPTRYHAHIRSDKPKLRNTTLISFSPSEGLVVSQLHFPITALLLSPKWHTSAFNVPLRQSSRRSQENSPKEHQQTAEKQKEEPRKKKKRERGKTQKGRIKTETDTMKNDRSNQNTTSQKEQAPTKGKQELNNTQQQLEVAKMERERYWKALTEGSKAQKPTRPGKTVRTNHEEEIQIVHQQISKTEKELREQQNSIKKRTIHIQDEASKLATNTSSNGQEINQHQENTEKHRGGKKRIIRHMGRKIETLQAQYNTAGQDIKHLKERKQQSHAPKEWEIRLEQLEEQASQRNQEDKYNPDTPLTDYKTITGKILKQKYEELRKDIYELQKNQPGRPKPTEDTTRRQELPTEIDKLTAKTHEHQRNMEQHEKDRTNQCEKWSTIEGRLSQNYWQGRADQHKINKQEPMEAHRQEHNCKNTRRPTPEEERWNTRNKTCRSRRRSAIWRSATK